MGYASPLINVAVLMFTVACSSHDADRHTDRERDRGSTSSTSPAARKLEADDEMRIVTVDSSVDLLLARDSISGGLSPQTLAKIRQTMDTAGGTSTGFAASIEKIVKTSVRSAVGTRVAFPLSAVKDVRYEGGTLRFEWNGAPVQIFENTKVNNRPVLESFRPDDAQRFAGAVRARKRALGAP